MVSRNRQIINQIALRAPEAKIFWIRNCSVKGRSISLSGNIDHGFELPTMYQSWTAPQKNHVVFSFQEQQNEFAIPPFRELMIFDTWGTSSYYHLLIDHIIPIWITREWMRENHGILNGEIDYCRISRNNYPTELSSAQEIFKHFLGKNFLEDASGVYKNLIYGYFFTYRPYLGPNQETTIWNNYKHWLQKFRNKFCISNENKSEYVIVPQRDTRDFEFVHNFVKKYNGEINFKIVEFSKLSIKEQISLAGGARAMFGSEGAAFANSVFMKNSSLIIPVAQENSRFLFHSALSNYIGQKFLPVHLDQSGASLVDEELVLAHIRAS